MLAGTRQDGWLRSAAQFVLGEDVRSGREGIGSPVKAAFSRGIVSMCQESRAWNESSGSGKQTEKANPKSRALRSSHGHIALVAVIAAAGYRLIDRGFHARLGRLHCLYSSQCSPAPEGEEQERGKEAADNLHAMTI